MENFHYEIVRKERYEEACRHLAEHNFPDEPTCKSIGLVWDEDANTVMMEALHQNMSIALVSDKTDEIIGLRIIHIGKRGEKLNVAKFHSEPVTKLLACLEYKDNCFDIYSHYNVEEAFQLFGLSIHREHRRKGLGLKLMQAALVFLSSLEIGPVVVKGDCSSNFSKRIYEKLDFELFGEIMFEDYKVDGKIVFANTGEHKSLKVYGKKI